MENRLRIGILGDREERRPSHAATEALEEEQWQRRARVRSA